ncbi:MAG: T9SS type A sorting domain-containing protein, partial [Flavobacterium sp.]
TVLRESTPLRRLDYTLWSSPVAGQNLLSFSPLTMTNRFYTYNPSTNVYNSIVPNSTSFETGVGYLIRMPDDHPTTPEIWEGDFLGVPNNGTVTVTVANDTYNAVGNPYPSTIDADDFIIDNNLTEALYFWRKINAAAGSAYATYTLAGGVGTDTSGSNNQIPNGIIQVGQGFIARSTSTSFVFNNEMRLGNNDNQFFRTANTEHNRVRLALNGSIGLYQEVLVNYMTGATNELDPAIDGKYINDSQTAFYTILNEEAYVIQGRALPFDNNDIVPLGFKTTQAGIYQISLMNADGLFTSEQQPIFIKDLDLNITHDFAEGNYSFTSELGIFDSRFELLFNNETLSVNQPELGVLDILVFNKEGVLNIQSTQNILKKVTLYDVNGRILLQQQPYSNTTQISLQEFSRQMILVTIETQNGTSTTKKIIH